MVLAAQENNVPVIVVTESRKLNRSVDNGKFRDSERDPEEILNDIRHPNLKALNLYFEEIPRYLVSTIITEKRNITD